MPYPPQLVEPMRRELTMLGVDELRTAEEVDQAMDVSKDQTVAVVINSVCGCAAGNARPAVRLAMNAPSQPDRYLTVFAGQDLEATAQMRSYLPGIPPSSPFIALFKQGQPAFILERRQIEGRTASAIAYDLAGAYDRFCGNGAASSSGSTEVSGDASETTGDKGMPDTFRSIL
jgi:putative YphP/YqiW family bacilliredoxin